MLAWWTRPRMDLGCYARVSRGNPGRTLRSEPSGGCWRPWSVLSTLHARVPPRLQLALGAGLLLLRPLPRAPARRSTPSSRFRQRRAHALDRHVLAAARPRGPGGPENPRAAGRRNDDPDGTPDTRLVRYLPDGALDRRSAWMAPSMTADGVMFEEMTVAPSGRSSWRDGRCRHRAGRRHGGRPPTARRLARPNFDGDGLVTVDGGLVDQACSVAVQSDGKILLAGERFVEGPDPDSHAETSSTHRSRGSGRAVPSTRPSARAA